MIDKNLVLDIPDGISAQTSDPLVFEQQVIYVGDFTKRNPTTGQVEYSFSIDEATIDHWVATHEKLKEAGIDVPMPEGHTEESSKRKSTVLSLSKKQDSKGRTSLFATHKFKDLESAKAHKASKVSLFSPPVFYHQDKTFVRPIRHIAFTDYPVIGDLDPSTTIAASYCSKEKPSMTKALALSLGIELPADATDESASKLIEASYKSLQAKADPAKADPAKADPVKADPVKNQIANQPDPIMLSLARDNRQMKIDRLVIDRKITSANAKELKEKWAGQDLSLSAESVSAFDSVLSTLEKLSPIVALSSEMSGSQKVPIEESPLVKDAKSRAK